MVELFKRSSEHYRAVLKWQIDELTSLQQATTRDESWRARNDFATALARDTLKRVLPPDSALYEMYGNLAASSAAAGPESSGVSAYELALFRQALENINWQSTDDSAGALPSTNSAYSDVERMLPQMVYRHPVFKALLALLVALVGTAAFGVFRFYNITVDIGQEIRNKQDKLAADFNSQKSELETAMAHYKSDRAAISEQLAGVGSNLTDAKKQIAQLEVEAQGTLARFTSQVGRNVDGEVAKAMDATRTLLDQRQQIAAGKIDEYWEKEARPLLKDAAEKRVDQLLADGGKPFLDKLVAFDSRVAGALKKQAELEGRQKVIDGKQLLTDKAYSLLTNPSPDVVDRMAAYIGEALWVIYGAAAVLVILVITNIILIVLKFRS
jgi:hypothetical protein